MIDNRDKKAHRELADQYFNQAAWSIEHSTAGYVELFLRMANYHLNKSK